MFSKKRKYISVIDSLQSHIDSLSQESRKQAEMLQSISDELVDDWEKKLMEKTLTITGLNRGREALTAVISNLKEKPPARKPNGHVQRYQISSLDLKDWHKYLVSDPNGSERLGLATGIIAENDINILSRMETVKLESQSPVYVQASKDDSHRKIVSFSEDYGHMLLGMFHSHMSKGAACTCPSSVDIKMLERKATIGVDCLGGIFSLDGYVRFFSLKEFEIDIYGKGVEPIESKPTYKIFKIIDRGDVQ